MWIGEEGVIRFLSIYNILREEHFAPGFWEHPNHNGVSVEEMEDENEGHEDEEGAGGEEEEEDW